MHDPIPMPAPERAPAFAAWHPLPDAAATVASIAGALAGFPVAVGLSVLASAFVPGDFVFRVVGALILFGCTCAAGALLGRARARRTTWHLDERGLHVRRGLVFAIATISRRTRSNSSGVISAKSFSRTSSCSDAPSSTGSPLLTRRASRSRSARRRHRFSRRPLSEVRAATRRRSRHVGENPPTRHPPVRSSSRRCGRSA